MNRRVALKNVALVMAGAILLPGCDLSKPSAEKAGAFLSPDQESLLAEIAETFIPATDTPGAKDLGVPAYMQVMLADCYEKDVQENFIKGLESVDKLARKDFGKSFTALSAEDRTSILKKIASSSDKEQQQFYGLLKGLTIRGYKTSEYVMTNHSDYKMIPGHYYGCVPVSSQKVS